MFSSRLAITVAFSALAATAGCAHDQKKAPAARPVAHAPAPAPAHKLAAAASEPADAPEAPATKDDPAIFFDFDSSLIKDDGHRVLQTVAEAVGNKKNASLKIEGNCDELGTTEYNLALGEERARAAKDYLVHLGVPSGRIATVSYGSQRPRYAGHDDEAHAKNRRDDLIVR